MSDSRSHAPTTATEEQELSCLIFRLIDKRYGVNALQVREIIRLPEVTPMEESPAYVIGVINLRGHVVPVVDLHLRMGRVSDPYLVSDAIIILEVHHHPLGVVISEVLEVRVFTPGEIEPPPDFGEQANTRAHHVITGVARTDDDIIMLLNPEQILSSWESLPQDNSHPEPGDPAAWRLADRRVFHPQATPEERAILRLRAKQLHMVQDLQDRHQAQGGDGKMALAIIDLYGELLGVELAIVLGFAPLRHVTPIPCTPAHIVGDMNLRGEILTLVALGQVLNMAPTTGDPMGKVLVVGWEGIKLGIPIQEVVDVIHLHPDDIAAPPARTGFLDREHLRGVTPYENKMVGIVDLRKILSHENLLVHETV